MRVVFIEAGLEYLERSATIAVCRRCLSWGPVMTYSITFIWASGVVEGSATDHKRQDVQTAAFACCSG
jgi:hypothetical protein